MVFVRNRLTPNTDRPIDRIPCSIAEDVFYPFVEARQKYGLLLYRAFGTGRFPRRPRAPVSFLQPLNAKKASFYEREIKRGPRRDSRAEENNRLYRFCPSTSNRRRSFSFQRVVGYFANVGTTNETVDRLFRARQRFKTPRNENIQIVIISREHLTDRSTPLLQRYRVNKCRT